MDQPPLTPGGQPVKTFYQYDTSGNLVEVDLPDGNKELWTYDPTWNEPVKYIDQQGLETDYALDPANGNILSVTHVSAADGNRTTSYQFTPAPVGQNDPPAGLVAKEFDPLGHETDFSYDKQGLVTEITYAVGTADQASVSFTYDGKLDLASETDELGRVTLVTMDNLDRLVETQLPPPDPTQPNVRPTTTQVWSGGGLLLQETDALGRVTNHHYDATGNEVELDQPDPAGGSNLTITRNTFDPAGNLISTTDPMSRVSSQLFDALNQVVTVRQPNPANGGATGGPASSVVYNALSDVIQEIDPAGNVTDNSYDVSGDLLSTTGPAPTPGAARPKVAYTYSPDGEVLSSTDAKASWCASKSPRPTAPFRPAPARPAPCSPGVTIKTVTNFRPSMATATAPISSTMPSTSRSKPSSPRLTGSPRGPPSCSNTTWPESWSKSPTN